MRAIKNYPDHRNRRKPSEAIGTIRSHQNHQTHQKPLEPSEAMGTIRSHHSQQELGIKGFCAVGGKTAQGKALYAKAKALYAA